MTYTPRTGARCGCKPGVHRDNCPNCEGSGLVIDFRAIHAAREAAQCRQAHRIRVVCRLNGAHTGLFTDGRTYEAKHHLNALYEVKDDLGYERYIIPGELCPFLKTGGIYSEKCVGRFEVVQPEGGIK